MAALPECHVTVEITEETIGTKSCGVIDKRQGAGHLDDFMPR